MLSGVEASAQNGSSIGSGNAKIDSLLTLLKSDKEDTNKVKHLYTLCNNYRKIGEYSKGLLSAKQAMELAQNLNWKMGVAVSLNNIGVIYREQGNYPKP